MQAVEQNPVKAGPWKEKAFQVRDKAENLERDIQRFKYNLVLSVDGEVFLGKKLNSEGDEIEENRFEIPFDELTKEQQNKKISDLDNKENRDASGELLVNSGEAKKLKQAIISYRSLLESLAGENEVLKHSITTSLNTEDKGKNGTNILALSAPRKKFFFASRKMFF